MTLTRQQIRALRKRRMAADAEAELTFQSDIAGPLMDLTAEILPPLTQCGWMETGHIGGGFLYCSDCSSQRPTTGHMPVYESSLYATRCCCICQRRLDHTTPF